MNWIVRALCGADLVNCNWFGIFRKLNWNMNLQSRSCFEWRCRQHELHGAIKKRNYGTDAEIYFRCKNQSGFIEAFRPRFGIDTASNVSVSVLNNLFQSFCSDEFIKQQFNWSSMYFNWSRWFKVCFVARVFWKQAVDIFCDWINSATAVWIKTRE